MQPAALAEFNAVSVWINMKDTLRCTYGSAEREPMSKRKDVTGKKIML